MDEIVRRAALAGAFSATVAARGDVRLARPAWDLNHVLAYGQSFSTGWEGWPALSRVQRLDSVMIGQSVRGLSESGTGWRPVGDMVLRPLVATVMSNGPEGAVLDDAAVAALPPGNNALGETPVEGAVNQWRQSQLQHRPETAPQVLLGCACGVGGRSIEALGKDGPHFGRLRDAAAAGRDAAAEAGQSHGVVAVMWLQGENNAVGMSGTGERVRYKELCAALHGDIVAALCDVTGQTAPPAVFAHQVGAAYVRDGNSMAVSQAQLEVALEREGWYLAAPAYPVTDKGFHLDANGYRWLGQQFGKVMHRVLDLGQGWLPLHPLCATARGAHVLVDFHVPHAPLVLDTCWAKAATVQFADGGFSVSDASGSVGIRACAVVAERCVLLVLEREAGPGAVLTYGDEAQHRGLGNLRDNDPAEAADRYEYSPGRGQYASAEIPALVGRPYPLWNWCVIFRIPIDQDPAPKGQVRPESADALATEHAPELVQAPTASVKPPPAPPEPAAPKADSPAWEVLRGTAAPPSTPPPDPAPSGGVIGWLRRIFARN